jgi:hypothetical protein
MGVNDKRSNDDRGDTNICNNGQKKFRVSICREDSMGDKRNSVWDRWDINKLCGINNNTNTNLYISKLRVSEDNDTTISNTDNGSRMTTNRSIYSDGRVRVLCVV